MICHTMTASKMVRCMAKEWVRRAGSTMVLFSLFSTF